MQKWCKSWPNRRWHYYAHIAHSSKCPWPGAIKTRSRTCRRRNCSRSQCRNVFSLRLQWPREYTPHRSVRCQACGTKEQLMRNCSCIIAEHAARASGIKKQLMPHKCAWHAKKWPVAKSVQSAAEANQSRFLRSIFWPELRAKCWMPGRSWQTIAITLEKTAATMLRAWPC